MSPAAVLLLRSAELTRPQPAGSTLAAMSTVISLPLLGDAWCARGAEFTRRGDHSGAAEAYEQATNTAPEMPRAWLGWGDSLAALGRWSEAEAAFYQAIALDPYSVPGYRGLAAVYRALDRPRQLRFCLGWTLLLDPGCVEALADLALTLEGAGQAWPAKRHWLAILKLGRDGPAADLARRKLGQAS